MNHEEIKNKVTDHFNRLEKRLEKISKRFDSNNIHELRVEYKKLRAFHRLLSVANKKYPAIKIPAKLKNTYHLLGLARDLQLLLKKIKEDAKYDPESTKELRILIWHEISRIKSLLPGMHAKHGIKSYKNKSFAIIPAKLKAGVLKKSVENNFLAIGKIISDHRFSDNDIHSVRKHLKDILYDLRELDEAAKKLTVLRVLKGRDENYFDQLLNELGEFNDSRTAIGLLSVYAMKEPVKKHNNMLENLKNRWVKDHASRKEMLLKRISAALVPDAAKTQQA